MAKWTAYLSVTFFLGVMAATLPMPVFSWPAQVSGKTYSCFLADRPTIGQELWALLRGSGNG